MTRRQGALIDTSRTLTITFDGRAHPAHPGDTLASALLASGAGALARGPYTGRPRGVWGIGSAGACCYVQVESGAGEPMVPATMVEAHEGLRARSLAGRGDLNGRAEGDHARYDKVWAHCDVLVVGGGPAGLAAARAAARTGARVLVTDDQPEPGGGARLAPRAVEGVSALEWARATAAELDDHDDARLLTRTTVTGHYHHGELIALQRRTDHLGGAAMAVARHRLWHIRARQVVLATGAAERPVAFAGNDRPGVMLAGAAAGYAWGYGAPPGTRAVVFGAHEEALTAAMDLLDSGVEIAAVLDARPSPGCVAAELRRRGVRVLPGHGAIGTWADGRGHLAGVRVAPIDATGRAGEEAWGIDCDLLAVSGGMDPVLTLWTQVDGGVRWSAGHAAFLPDEGAPPGAVRCAGAARGTRALTEAIAEGTAAGNAAAIAALGERPRASTLATQATPAAEPSAAGDAAPLPLWLATGSGTEDGEVFVDRERDATLADVRAALDAGLTGIEHVKRYTTIGTGPDQGRACGVLAGGIVGQLRGLPAGEVGAPRHRPPYAAIPFAALAGRDRGDFLTPVRRTPMHDWHTSHGAVFEDVGQWRRARYYPRPDGRGGTEDTEDMATAVLRECRAAREGVAVLDASTLGKITVEGRDAGTFLDRIYTNTMSSLPVGRCRYGVMCGADGMVLDDGVVARPAPDSYLVTTTTGNAETVLEHLEEWAQTEWPGLCVHLTPVTEHWATISVVGPRSRDVLRRLAPGLDLAGFEFMGIRAATVAGVPARILRVSFTGELTYEIYVPSWYGLAVWEAVLAAGQPHGITPYGTEAMHVLRAEKGFIVVGHETDGQVTPVDAGLGWAVSKRKDFVGKRSLARADTARADRERLVGLLPEEPTRVLAEGAQLIADPAARPPVPTLGHVTSSYRSAALGRSFALALLADGARRHGELLYAYHLGETVPVRVSDPVFYDREGARRDG